MLEHMNRRLHGQRTFADAIYRILDDARALNGAEFGTLQLCVGDYLLIVHQHGFEQPFLDTFRRVNRDEGSACGRALRAGKTVLIEDVEKDEEFAPYGPVARKAGFRSVVTTPLVTARPHMIGVVSTHFARVHRPTSLEIGAFEQYGRVASNHLWELRGNKPLAEIAIEMNARLYTMLEIPSLNQTERPLRTGYL
jgi:GAF domain-containing protein